MLGITEDSALQRDNFDFLFPKKNISPVLYLFIIFLIFSNTPLHYFDVSYLRVNRIKRGGMENCF